MSARFAHRLQSALAEPDRHILRQAAVIAADMNCPLYVVGGPVRDCLLGRSIVDFDLTVEGDAIELARRVAREIGGSIKVHQRFGTAKLILPARSHSIDFAMTRTETYARPAALPDVTAGTLQTDLIRRDFTINAMAIRLDGKHWGELIDLYQGQNDLRRGLIRVLHDRSFIDDPTRMLRAARFEQRFDFSLEPNTLRLVQAALPTIDQVSGDRLRHELESIFREDRPDKSLARLAEWGVLRQINVELRADAQLRAYFQNTPAATEQPPGGIAARAIIPAEQHGNTSPFDRFRCWAWLLHAYSPDGLARVTRRLNLPREDIIDLEQVVALRDRQASIADTPSPSALYRQLRRYHERALRAALTIVENERARRKIDHFLNDLRDVRLTIGGAQLQAMGQTAGPAMGRILDALRDAVLDGIVIGPQQEAEYVRALIAHERPGLSQDTRFLEDRKSNGQT